jgi:RNA polymerase sigma-B factor
LTACKPARPTEPTPSTESRSSNTRGEGQRALGDRLAENDRAFELTVDLLALRPLLAQLPSRERNILLMRFYGEPVGGVARHA